MPGLVNAHTHSPSNLLKGTWSRLPLEIWRQYIRAGWREYSDDAIYISAQLGLVEMIRTGCTCVLDHFYTGSSSPHMGALHAVAAMVDAGVRGGLALTLSDRQYEATVGIDIQSVSKEAQAEIGRISQLEGAESIEDFLRFAEAVRLRTDLVVPIVGPSAPHRCSDELLMRCMEVARELDTTIHVHVCETKGQFLQGRKLFGATVVAHLDEIGLLNERLSMAHCVWLTENDIERVARKGAVAIHNPASNGKLGSGRMRFDAMLRRGVRVGLATDGSGSNDTAEHVRGDADCKPLAQSRRPGLLRLAVRTRGASSGNFRKRPCTGARRQSWRDRTRPVSRPRAAHDKLFPLRAAQRRNKSACLLRERYVGHRRDGWRPLASAGRQAADHQRTRPLCPRPVAAG